MAAEYQVILRDTTGAKKYTVADFTSLTYTKKRNYGGNWEMEVPEGNAIVGQVADKWLVEILRRVPDWGIDWYTDFYGVLRDEDLSRPGRLNRYKVSGISQLDILRWRHVMWYANTANRSAFTSAAAETIVKTLVTYNMTASATTGAGRVRNGAMTNFTITVEADGAGGNTISSYGCAWENLLASMYQIALIGGGDYTLEYDESTHQWEFKWHNGQEGDDRRAAVRFAINFDNMAEPRYVVKRSEEKTACIVVGRGRDNNREWTEVLGDNYSAANDIELTYNASNVETANGRTVAGERKLREIRAVQAFTFTPEQVAAFAYGKHYCVDGEMGDLVTARWESVEGDFQVEQVTVTVSRSEEAVETVNLGIEAYP
jgi:hypothetical protein